MTDNYRVSTKKMVKCSQWFISTMRGLSDGRFFLSGSVLPTKSRPGNLWALPSLLDVAVEWFRFKSWGTTAKPAVEMAVLCIRTQAVTWIRFYILRLRITLIVVYAIANSVKRSSCPKELSIFVVSYDLKPASSGLELSIFVVSYDLKHASPGLSARSEMF